MSGFGVLELFDKLIEQTQLGNVKWLKGSEVHQYVWAGSSGEVLLKSIDEDGMLPVQVTVLDTQARIVGTWRVNYESSLVEEEFDRRVKMLWNLVSSEHDTIAGLIRDLDSLPPF